MTARQLIVWLIAMWTLFAALTAGLRTDHVFHCIDAIAVAAQLIVLYSYAPGVLDAWRNRERGIWDGQLLAIGVFAAAFGLTIRLSRWYVTNAIPVTDGGVAAWVYNVGLWISVCAAGLLVGAVATSPPQWSVRRILGCAGAFLALVVILLQFDFAFFE